MVQLTETPWVRRMRFVEALRMADVFLSYSSKDRQRVKLVHDALVRAGISVFWDQDIPPGEDWEAWIKRRLAEARVVVVLWTTAAATSRNVTHEAAIALEWRMLVPALLEPLKASDLPLGFYSVQAVDLHDWSGDESHEGWMKLYKQVAERVDTERRRERPDAGNPELTGWLK